MAARATYRGLGTAPSSITPRILAPLALIACGIALALLISSALPSGDGRGGDEAERKDRKEHVEKPEVTSDTYVVQPGDTLTGVADKSGVSLARLERLNPDIDPQTLNAGQVINLREAGGDPGD